VVYRLARNHRVEAVHSFAGPRHDGSRPYTVVEADGALYGSTSHSLFHGGGWFHGVAYRLESASGLTILHTFNYPEGTGDLTLASNGDFYGAGIGGGVVGRGAVFRMDQAGNTTVLWLLGEDGDPSEPYAGVIEATDGRLYGTTYGGGDTSLFGTVYTLRKDGSDRRVLRSFWPDGSGAHPMAPVTQAADGDLYGVTVEGGPHYYGGTVFRLGLDGAYERLHTFGGEGDGSYPKTPLLEIRPGVFIGTTHFGGRADVGVNHQVHADGRYKVLHHFGGEAHGAPDGLQSWGALQLAAPGHVLGTCMQGGAFGKGVCWLMHVDSA